MSLAGGSKITGQVFTEQALILENFADTAKRLDAKLASSSVFDLRKSTTVVGAANVVISEAIRAQLLQILVGNTDYILEIYNTRFGRSFYYNDLRNVALISKQGSAELHPLIYDFDIASIVVGHENSAASKSWEHVPEISEDPVTMVMLKQLLRLRTLVKPNELQAQVDFYGIKKQELLRAAQTAYADQKGRDIAVNHVEHFFKALEMMESSEFQFLQIKEILFTKDPGKSNTNLLKRNAADDRPGRLRAGTPFVILGEEKEFLKILVIDIYNDLQDYNQRVGYIKKNAVYSSEVNASEVPYFDSRSLFQ